MGASLALASCPGRAGEYAALTGARLDAADVVALGLATHCVASSSIDEIFDALALVVAAFVVDGSLKFEYRISCTKGNVYQLDNHVIN